MADRKVKIVEDEAKDERGEEQRRNSAQSTGAASTRSGPGATELNVTESEEERRTESMFSTGPSGASQAQIEKERRNLEGGKSVGGYFIREAFQLQMEEERRNSAGGKSVGYSTKTSQEPSQFQIEEERRNSAGGKSMGGYSKATQFKIEEERRNSPGGKSVAGYSKAPEGFQFQIKEERRNSAGGKSMGAYSTRGAPEASQAQIEEERRASLTQSMGGAPRRGEDWIVPVQSEDDRRNSASKSIGGASTQGPEMSQMSTQPTGNANEDYREMQEDSSLFSFLPEEGVKALFKEVLPETIEHSDFYNLVMDVLSSYETLPSNECNMPHGKNCDKGGSLFWSMMVMVLETLLDKAKGNAAVQGTFEECNNRSGPPPATQQRPDVRDIQTDAPTRGSAPPEDQNSGMERGPQERKFSGTQSIGEAESLIIRDPDQMRNFKDEREAEEVRKISFTKSMGAASSRGPDQVGSRRYSSEPQGEEERKTSLTQSISGASARLPDQVGSRRDSNEEGEKRNSITKSIDRASTMQGVNQSLASVQEERKFSNTKSIGGASTMQAADQSMMDVDSESSRLPDQVGSRRDSNEEEGDRKTSVAKSVAGSTREPVEESMASVQERKSIGGESAKLLDQVGSRRDSNEEDGISSSGGGSVQPIGESMASLQEPRKSSIGGASTRDPNQIDRDSKNPDDPEKREKNQ